MNDTEYLPLSGVCKLLGGAGKSTVRTWIKTRNFPKPIRISQKSALYRRSDVAAWMEAQAAKANLSHPLKVIADYGSSSEP